MKTTKKLFSILLLTFGSLAYAQVGVGTNTPEATLDVRGENHSTTPGAVTSTDGVLVPRVNNADMSTATNGSSDGQLVYNVSDQTFYFWNANTSEWQAVRSTVVTAGSNVTVTGDGSPSNPYEVSATGGGGSNPLNFVSTNASSFNVTSSNDIIEYTGSTVTDFTLPSNVDVGKIFWIINNGNDVVQFTNTITTSGTQTAQVGSGFGYMHVGSGDYACISGY
jgi:hypothetical protein